MDRSKGGGGGGGRGVDDEGESGDGEGGGYGMRGGGDGGDSEGGDAGKSPELGERSLSNGDGDANAANINGVANTQNLGLGLFNIGTGVVGIDALPPISALGRDGGGESSARDEDGRNNNNININNNNNNNNSDSTSNNNSSSNQPGSYPQKRRSSNTYPQYGVAGARECGSGLAAYHNLLTTRGADGGPLDPFSNRFIEGTRRDNVGERAGELEGGRDGMEETPGIVVQGLVSEAEAEALFGL